MDKSPDAFRTISEVADDLDLPQHVLRFWETRFPQIKPMKRGGGRRYYRPDDVDLLKGIRHLLYDHGYTIKGVQKLLKANGNRFVAAIASGDMATMEAIMAASGEKDTADPRVAHPDDDEVVGRPKAKPSGRFFGFGGSSSSDTPEISIGKSSINKDDRALLQEALFDLLECKRLLDQVR
ncbi:MerR family transcriptional regulator [Agrobacterium sp.]|uniref:MerR family transcriptional regulator n=1 Tax=Agrobacterium sp. TaxID=361 RepID=UPI0028AC43D5|nr:MerR family transcriptional regulator [Agrobacterium sp.]